jgi:alpha-mannosidase
MAAWLPPQKPVFDKDHSGYSLLVVDNPAVILECIKAPEPPFGQTKQKKDRALVLRLYESLGGHCRTVIHFNAIGGLTLGQQIAGAWETDMLERQKADLHHTGDSITLEFRPFEIKTVLVEFWEKS